MKICHTQPHLVPPMELGIDDHPRPGAPTRSSVPSWVVDGRNLVTRTSSRASLSFKRKSTAPLRISGPSEFRTVSSFATSPKGFHPDSFILISPGEFHPLKLSFETPDNRLSNLPEFDDFQLEEERSALARPPRAVRNSTEISRLSRSKTHRPSSSFQLARKPVGSGYRRSSLGCIEQLMDRQAPGQDPLVPHFSRPPAMPGLATTPHPPTHTGLETNDGRGAVWPKPESGREAPPRTPTNPDLQDRPLPPIPIEESPSQATTQRPPTTPTETRPPTTPSENRNPNTTPTRSGRVTQWLFQTNSNSNKAASPTSSPSQWKASFADRNPFRIRSRTLSGSTLASTLTNLTGGFRTTPSQSSTTMPPTPIRPSHMDPFHLEKELDMPTSFSRPYIPKQPDQPATIFEGPHQQSAQQDFDEYGHNYYTTYRKSAVGLAF
ncbi:hypothetical protein BDV25DRAFT_155087 [Aspergillus avenaceus]|uniref:Uncharacterized protein n=1 Tax=Aspergillus avenaceus TaxID=36643 RepID=A0A5N6TUK6_ASPAV|nr:hypothetical protein BDV25DRAFT_155087 [Aspergillus avenaceus]